MIEYFTLSNGLRVILETMSQLRSVAIGVWVKAGSMLETPEENGLSHLMEHMAFKRTQCYSAKELAAQMDAIGGHMNAATSKLYTTYYAKVVDKDLPRAAELLSQIVCHPVLDADDLEKEKNVVIEEISMVDDSPEDIVFDLLNEAMYAGQSLAMTITGTADHIRSYQVDDLQRFRRRYYSPQNAVISVAGHVRKDALLALLEEHFGGWQGGEEAYYPVNQPNRLPGRLCRDKKVEQMHLCLGYAGIDQEDTRQHDLMLLNAVFGGGVSSRLFQRVREEQGLVYSIYSGPSFFPGCGDYQIYAACTPANVPKVLQQIERERQRILEEGISQEEFDLAKTQLRCGFVLGQESAYARMSSLGVNLLVRGKVNRPSETLRRIEAVSQRKVARLAKVLLSGQYSLALVGKNARRYLGA